MGITSENFLENVYNVIFAPKQFFNQRELNVSVRLGLCIVIFMSVFNKIAFAISNNSISGLSFIFKIIAGIVGSLIAWFMIALFIEYTAKIFDKSGNLPKFLYLSAFAMIPKIFYAPLNLLKQAGEVGYVLSVILGFFLFCWIIFLYACAIQNSYGITLARSFMLIFLPLIAFVLAVYQFVGFYCSMWYIFSV